MRGSVERDLEDEFRFHLDQLIEKNIAKGIAPAEARNLALRQMGGVTRFRQECRDMRRVSLVENFAQNVRYAIRTLKKTPAVTQCTTSTGSCEKITGQSPAPGLSGYMGCTRRREGLHRGPPHMDERLYFSMQGCRLALSEDPSGNSRYE